MPIPSPHQRMPGEKFEPWNAFCMWRDMPAPRSLRALEAKMANPPSYRTLQRWRTDYEWDDRAALWDAQKPGDYEHQEMSEIIKEAVSVDASEWWADHERKVRELQVFHVKVGSHLAAMGVTGLERVNQLIKDGVVDAKLQDATIAQISSFMAANTKLIEEGLALRERALAVDEMMRSANK